MADAYAVSAIVIYHSVILFHCLLVQQRYSPIKHLAAPFYKKVVKIPEQSRSEYAGIFYAKIDNSEPADYIKRTLPNTFKIRDNFFVIHYNEILVQPCINGSFNVGGKIIRPIKEKPFIFRVKRG